MEQNKDVIEGRAELVGENLELHLVTHAGYHVLVQELQALSREPDDVEHQLEELGILLGFLTSLLLGRH